MSAKSNRNSKIDWDDYTGIFYVVGIILVIILISFWSNISSAISGHGWDPNVASSCVDVTSYDRNWDNDMKCTRPDGSIFYTDYAGAKEAESKSSGVTDTSISRPTESPSVIETEKTNCTDVTSYDHNWDNDMYCTRPDGTTFYTDYAGARAAEE